MRLSRPLSSPNRPPSADPMSGARAAVWLAAAALGIVLGLNVGLPLPHPALSPRGQAQTSQAEVAVLLFPDLEGNGDFAPDCTGCDGRFSSGDRLLADRDPLPRLDVTLVDRDGTELTMRTRFVEPGRQETLFRVDQPGAYTVTLRALPAEWQLCPNAAQQHTVVAADFDATTRQAAVRLALGHACRRIDAGATRSTERTTPAPSESETAAPSEPTPGVPAGSGAAATPPATAGAADEASDRPSEDADDHNSVGGADRAADASADPSGARATGGASLDAYADASSAPLLPQTGRSGDVPVSRPAGFALLAVLAAALGAGGRQLNRRPISRRSGHRPRHVR